MLSFARRMGSTVLPVLGLVFALVFASLSSAQAANSNKSAKQKPVASQKADRKAKAVRQEAKKTPAKKRVAVAPRKSVKRDTRVAQRAPSGTQKERTQRKIKTVAAKSPARQDGARALAPQRTPVVRAVAPTHAAAGLLQGDDEPLALSSSVALVMDQKTGEILFSKNDEAVLPIASLTKLMTGLVIADAQLSMDEPITITRADIDTHKGSRSRLPVGTVLPRGELLHLALMSSENRAAHALGRTFPGGMRRFVALMNAKAQDLGMNDTRFVEPTGLLSQNRSSARDLATLASIAYERPILRDMSTSPSHQLALGRRTLEYRNSNRLISNPSWDIGLQKTGYISEAGRCLVMQATVAGRELIMVFLDASGSVARARDAERIRHWVEAQGIAQDALRPRG